MGSISYLAQRQPVEVGPGQEPWFKVPGLSLICCVTTGSHLIFLNLGQNKGIKYLLSLIYGYWEGHKRERGENTWKMLSNGKDDYSE